MGVTALAQIDGETYRIIGTDANDGADGYSTLSPCLGACHIAFVSLSIPPPIILYLFFPLLLCSYPIIVVLSSLSVLFQAASAPASWKGCCQPNTYNSVLRQCTCAAQRHPYDTILC